MTQHQTVSIPEICETTGVSYGKVWARAKKGDLTMVTSNEPHGTGSRLYIVVDELLDAFVKNENGYMPADLKVDEPALKPVHTVTTPVDDDTESFEIEALESYNELGDTLELVRALLTTPYSRELYRTGLERRVRMELEAQMLDQALQIADAKQS